MSAETDKMSLIGASLAETHRNVERAQAAVDNGHPLDLRELEASTALLCAQALDLPPTLRPQARAALETLQQPIQHLFETLAGRAG